MPNVECFEYKSGKVMFAGQENQQQVYLASLYFSNQVINYVMTHVHIQIKMHGNVRHLTSNDNIVFFF